MTAARGSPAGAVHACRWPRLRQGAGEPLSQGDLWGGQGAWGGQGSPPVLSRTQRCQAVPVDPLTLPFPPLCSDPTGQPHVMVDYYEALGVSRNATAEDIKKA